MCNYSDLMDYSDLMVNLYHDATLSDKFEFCKLHSFVLKARNVSNVDITNPDPTQPFMGLDDRWYKIVAPSGVYNCYLLAMGWIVSVPYVDYGIPGILSTGLVPRTKNDYLEYIIADLEKANRKVYEVFEGSNIPEKLPKASPSTYWVKVYFSGDDLSTFHISRKDERSGRWIHKLGWTQPVKVICENLEFKDWRDIVATASSDLFYESSIEAIEEFANLAGIKLYGGITKSRWESRDNAGYNAYNPEVSPNSFTYYEPHWVLRIDK